MILQFRVGGLKVEGREGRGCNPPISNPGWSDRDKGGEAGEEQKLAACEPWLPEGRAEHVHDEAVANNDHAFLTSCTIPHCSKATL